MLVLYNACILSKTLGKLSNNLFVMWKKQPHNNAVFATSYYSQTIHKCYYEQTP